MIIFFVYFFTSEDEAKAYQKEILKKSGIVWLFSLIFGESTKVKYDRYDYMVLESYRSDSNKSRKDMIKIFEKAIYN